jgi:UDP-N-acetylmuramoylalanine--D-glutamate ligase
VTGAFAGVRAVVIGFGTSGRAAAEVLAAEGAMVRVSEARPLETVPSHPGDGAPDVELLAGGHRPEHLDGMDLVVVSPGVPQGAPVVRWAADRGLPIWSELELGARLCAVPVVAVTGTNGKTTTVEVLAAMLRAAGLRARACGNVGFPFSVAARQPFDALAVEASSFQLRFQQTFHPKVSVLLNLAPDHLDWHGSFEDYAEAKGFIFANQEDGDVHVGNAEDEAAAALSARARCAVRWFGTSPPVGGHGRAGTWVERGRLTSTGRGSPVEVPLPPGIRSGALALDAAAAVEAGLAFGLPVEAVREGVAAFPELPHRGAVVAEVEGVPFVDDSKATNPHAALASLAGRRDVVLIAGGLAKGVDLMPLRAATPSLRSVVALGGATDELARVFAGAVPVRRSGSIEEAVGLAFDEARDGGTVLLAPACASQDMFRDYRERGERFTAAARALGEQGAGGAATASALGVRRATHG